VGLDSIPVRMFNPYTQAQKHDKGAEYIRRWVPELQDVDPDMLMSGDAVDLSTQAEYPAPIVEHGAAYHRATEAYAEAKAAAENAGYGRYDVTSSSSSPS